MDTADNDLEQAQIEKAKIDADAQKDLIDADIKEQEALG